MTEKKYELTELFGSDVFNEAVMKAKLPHATFKELMKTMYHGKALTLPIAEVVASAMKDWAVEKGATHYTHWFQPMTGITAGKHDSFISPVGDGTVIMEFSGKELIKGESDASSFPSGGLRATFEARGYTAWDPTSYAFVKDNTLYIPTAFFSYSGEALDKKTPLLRSMDALSKQAVRILRLFGNNTASKVIPTVGAEQEYFLIDKKLYDKRKDLIFTGRTLFGAPPVKRQELDDHYFGAIKPRVSEYMKDLDEHLWALGVASKTKHNEVAPAQHECAPIFESCNLAADHNQLTMEVMKNVALDHGLVCLLHEKPFAGVNGSGKHDNWSLSTDDGQNLLNPGKSPMENAQFLTFLAAIIKAVDEHADLLRISVASAGNDHRLGANEAPPAIISVFLGDELNAVLDALISGKNIQSKRSDFDLGISSLPKIPKDTTDRNRTSPFAFTGNKFEFRSVGSSLNISGPNIVLNTIVADVLEEFADCLENAADFNTALGELLVYTIKKHSRVIFNGNGYDDAWVKEATENRNLPHYKTTADALPHFLDEKNIRLFSKHKVFTDVEMHSRTEILLENYCKVIHIEAVTMSEMARREIIPAVMKCEKDICDLISSKRMVKISAAVEEKSADRISALLEKLSENIEYLEGEVSAAEGKDNIYAASKHYCDKVIAAMNDLRKTADELEASVGESYWPFPNYEQLLFSV